MTYLCGIYGYQITKEIEIDGFKIMPLTNDDREAKRLAREEHSYNLTAVLVLVGEESPSDNFLFNLEAVLAFIEHLDVLITYPLVEKTGENIFSQFDSKIIIQRRNNGGGVVIPFEDKREIFVKLAMDKLQDNEKFKTLFFNCVEAFRSTSLQEVQYFLLFSGLETFVRAETGVQIKYGDKKTNVSPLVSKFLREYGFNISNSNKDLKRAFSSYTHIRNALFHNSEFKVTKKIKGKDETFALRDYFSNFKLLVPLVILKIVDFDDGYISWDKWIKLQ